VAELAGKDLTELIAEGRKKVGSVPSGGAAAPAAAAGENLFILSLSGFHPDLSGKNRMSAEGSCRYRKSRGYKEMSSILADQ
jgi:hypothetical protein